VLQGVLQGVLQCVLPCALPCEWQDTLCMYIIYRCMYVRRIYFCVAVCVAGCVAVCVAVCVAECVSYVYYISLHSFVLQQ